MIWPLLRDTLGETPRACSYARREAARPGSSLSSCADTCLSAGTGPSRGERGGGSGSSGGVDGSGRGSGCVGGDGHEVGAGDSKMLDV